MGGGRHPATTQLLQWFTFAHLPSGLVRAAIAADREAAG